MNKKEVLARKMNQYDGETVNAIWNETENEVKRELAINFIEDMVFEKKKAYYIDKIEKFNNKKIDELIKNLYLIGLGLGLK